MTPQTAIAQTGHNNPPSDAEILQERLRDNHQQLLDRTDKLLEAASRLPESIDDGDEDMAGKITQFIAQITQTTKALDKVRVAEKEPFLTQGRVVDGFFKQPSDALERIKCQANRPLTEYLTRKAEAERRERDRQAQEARERARLEMEAAIAAAPQQQPEALDRAAAIEQTAAKLEKQADARPAELAKVRSTTGAAASLRTVWKGEVTDRAALDLEALRQHIPADALQKAINSFVAAGGRELRGAVIREVSEAVTR